MQSSVTIKIFILMFIVYEKDSGNGLANVTFYVTLNEYLYNAFILGLLNTVINTLTYEIPNINICKSF